MTGRMAHSAFARAAHLMAPPLLGAVIVTGSGRDEVRIVLTEVEAYEDSGDPASHAYRGLSGRNRTMFGPPGHLYVYRHLGLHFCLNVTSHPAGRAGAILLRAGRVAGGVELARRRRLAGRSSTPADEALARGPANLAVCLGLDLAADGACLIGSPRLPAGQGGESRTRPEAGLGGGVDTGPRPALGWGVVSPPGCGGTEQCQGGAERSPGAVPLVRLVGSPGRVAPSLVANGPRVGVAGAGADPSRFPWRWWVASDSTVSSYRPAPVRRGRES
jgi:DNA-3-methyladenine glycosylase